MSREVVGRPMEILLVEDSLSSARLTIGALRHGNLQHRLTWLASGEEALEFLLRHGKFVRAPQPDLILLDLGLPGLDGRDILARIKSDDRLKEIPVVVLTASTSQEDIDSCKHLQVESYLTKPVDLEKFLQLVKELKQFWHSDVILPHVD